MKSRLVSMLLTGFVLALGLLIAVQVTQSLRGPQDTISEAPQNGTDVLNQTISPVVFSSVSEQNNQLRLSGTCEPDAVVTLQNQGENSRQIKANSDGQWSVVINVTDKDVLILDLIVFVENDVRVRSDETLYRIPPPPLDDAAELESVPSRSALLMIAAPGGPSRIIQSPFRGLPKSGALSIGPVDYDQSGSALFSGTSEAEGQVRILANNIAVGTSRVGANGRWFILAPDTLPVGASEITVELLTVTGETFQIILPFERLKDQKSDPEAKPLNVKYQKHKWQISRRLYGGGRQFTAVFAPQIVAEEENSPLSVPAQAPER